MNKSLLRKLGFGKQVESIEQFKCPACGKDVDILKEFKDKLSLIEYHISGLCQDCQNQMFDE